MTPMEMALRVAQRARARRLALGLRQADLAARAGVSLASLRRFEQTGAVGFDALLNIALALDALSDFAGLFAEPEIRSLDDLRPRPPRQRVRLPAP